MSSRNEKKSLTNWPFRILYDAGLRAEMKYYWWPAKCIHGDHIWTIYFMCAARLDRWATKNLFFILTVITRFHVIFETFILATCGSSSMPKETSKPFTIVETIFFALFSRSWHSATSSSNPFTKFSFFSAVKIKEIALPSLTVRATGTKWDFPIYVFACLSTVQIEECEAWNNFPKASWSVGMLDSRSF